ncbi:50S ribosomal protein L25/general stress protein Ctc [Breoghania sp. L-A4]|uniref:50S ribosomal protein L25/general stress protein Ctc n=1 Tax=Breoghania sp. L-A4 TaxID=2304600 RepID=UPI000E35C21D|nr:50S ribosomal protein L25/general stress protein Ctc [Breoghania sp. L-A4]AXS41454.1 50S ribosomal protein L25/general stress protein Ctc [Breoghania sp. L-A4]
MAQSFELQATSRDRVGKGSARALRRDGKIPAVIYGANLPPLSIALPLKETTLQLNTGGFLTHVANITVDGEKIQVIARDYQLDPVRDFLVHVDFLRISAKSRIAVEVPVHFENEEESPGIKRGGVLNIVRHTVELEAPATQIPESIDIDLTGLDIGDSVHISSVKLPDGVTPTITDRDFTIATIAAPAGLKEELKGEGEEGEEDEEGTEE